MELSLEHIVFNLLVFILILFGVLASVLNMAIGLHWAVQLLSLLGVIFLLFLYYYSRVLKVFRTIQIWLLVATSLVVLGTIFFFNGGADGPLAFIFLMIMTVVIIISPEKVQVPVFVTFFMVVILLYVVEWLLPVWTVGYDSRASRYLDIISTLAYCLAFIASTIIVFKRSYNQEKLRTARKNEELVSLNVTLVKKNEQIQLLMRELNHRVKNNLQVVSDMLSLQAKRSGDFAIAAALKDGRDRLMSMALLHKKFYDEQSLYLVTLEGYLNDLITYLVDDPTCADMKVHIIKQIENIELTQNQALPFGLIINEVITNCQKHAFPDSALRPEILIDCRVIDDYLIVHIQDNGVGIAPGKIAIGNGSFGLELINLLVMQIDGEWSICRNEHVTGTSVDIKFPLNPIF